MIGVRQVVVDRLGHANDTHFVTALDGFLVNLVGCVLGIVAARVEEVTNVVRLKNLEQPVHLARGSFGLVLEINFVPAGAEGGRGCVFQSFNRRPFLLLQIDQILVENS